MPELPDVELYVEHLRKRVLGKTLERVRLKSPFLLRTVDPPLRAIEGKRVESVERLGKRIVFGFADDLFAVLHLMIAGRLRFRPRGADPPGKIGLAAFDFETGTLLVTEASSKKRASLHIVRGREALGRLSAGGVEVLAIDLNRFRAVLLRENHTLKRALTDPRLFSGIGNAYSDEILFCARLSPVKLTSRLDEGEIERLYEAARGTLLEWSARLRDEAKDEFPEKVTAFRDGMAVHGRYGKPCPRCGSPVQRIAYAENETNYCARCQTGGKLLADRGLSRLLSEDWPKSLDELEEHIEARRLEPKRAPR